MTTAEKSPMREPQGVVSIRNLREADYPSVSRIQQEGMDTGEATFEDKAPAWEEFKANRILPLSFVAVDDTSGEILGWISASPASKREVFKGVVEDSIYIAASAAGRGVGGKLLDHLIAECIKQGYWAMHSSIFPENEGSVRLHKSRGFKEVGTFHSMAKMGYGPKKGQWRDNQMFELIFEDGPAGSKARAADEPAQAQHPDSRQD